MDLEKFKEEYDSVKYPNKKDFQTGYFYHEGSVVAKFSMATQSGEFNEFRRENKKMVHEICMSTSDLKEYGEQQSAYRKHISDMHAKFKKEIFEEFGVEDNPKREVLFEKAWEIGHDEGYRQVYYMFDELVDLIK